MKSKIPIILLVLAFTLAFMAIKPVENCKRFDVREGIEVYTESGHATNYIADLQPGDVLYVCGD